MSDFRMRTYEKNALSSNSGLKNEKSPVVRQAVLSSFTEKEVNLSLYKDSQENLLRDWIESRLLSKEEWQEKRQTDPSSLEPKVSAFHESATFKSIQGSSSLMNTSAGGLETKKQGFARRGDFSQLEKVAKFLLTLSKEKVSEIFKYLDKREIEAIVRQMLRTPCLKNPVEVYELHQDFKQYLIQTKNQVKGGKQTAKTILEKALGEQRAEQFLKKVELAQHVPFAFLQDLGEKEIWEILKKESSAVLAVVFNFLNRTQAKYIVNKLESTKQKDLFLRLARMDRVHAGILQSVEDKISQKTQEYLLNASESLEGKEVLAEILQHMDPTTEENLLKSLDLDMEQKEELGELLFNMDVVLRMQDEDLHKVLKDYSCVEIALLLKGKNEEIRDKVLANLSKRRQEDVDQEFYAMGRVYLKEVDLLTRRFLNDLKERHNKGKITIFRKNEEFIS